MLISANNPDVKGLECKHAVYVPATDGTLNDLLVVKEYVHWKDGRAPTPQLRTFENYKRPFWITKELHRKHEQKKELEKIDRLQKFEATQIGLVRAVSRALGRAPTANSSLRMVARSPYVYGCDVTTPVLAKHHYLQKWPDCFSDNRVAVVDTETDMVQGHEEIIMASITMKSQVRLVIVKSFLRAIQDPTTKIHKKFEELLGHIKAARNINLEIEYVDNPGHCAVRIV